MKFTLSRLGSISNLHLLHSSGVAADDDAATKAVSNASPFRPLPEGSPEKVMVECGFGVHGQVRGSAPVEAPFPRSLQKNLQSTIRQFCPYSQVPVLRYPPLDDVFGALPGERTKLNTFNPPRWSQSSIGNEPSKSQVQMVSISQAKRIIASRVPVVIHVRADWCVPCRQMVPIFEQVARESAPRVVALEVDYDQNSTAFADLVQNQQDSIPTFAYYRNGQLLSSNAGRQTLETLRQFFRGKSN